MAEKEDEEPKFTNCGYCLVKEEQMRDPRVLPCSHVFCTGCMIGQYGDDKMITCPFCGATFNGDVHDLPRHEVVSSAPLCDVCVEKGKGKEPAVTFCTTCSRKFCAKHQESHDDIYTKHTTISMVAYKTAGAKLEIRYCSEHESNPYSLGCNNCRRVFCSGCISSGNRCIKGNKHELIKLAELESMLKEDYGKRCEDVVAKEEMLANVYKNVFKMASEYQVETAEMVSSLQQTRDEQVEELVAKYKLLEKEILQSRMNVQKQMETFLVEEGSNALTELQKQKKRIETKFSQENQVDVVLEFDSLMATLKELMDREVATCTIKKNVALETLGKKRELEIRIKSAGNIHLGQEQRQTYMSMPPPKSMTLINSVALSSFCHSVCYAKGDIYGGTQDKTIDKIDGDFNRKPFVSWSGMSWSYGIIYHEEKLYTFKSGDRSLMDVYDLSGQRLSTWIHRQNYPYIRPAIISNRLVFPDSSINGLAIFTLSGKFIKNISGLTVIRNGSAVCAVDKNSVAFTSFSSSQVLRVNIDTGETIWICQQVTNPHGLAVYENEYVAVVSEAKLSFIKIKTGKVETELHNSKIAERDWRMDVGISGATAAVSVGGNKLLYFNLEAST